MRRALVLAALLAGCSVTVNPPAVTTPGPGKASPKASPKASAPAPRPTDAAPSTAPAAADRPEAWLDGWAIAVDQDGRAPRMAVWTGLAPADGLELYLGGQAEAAPAYHPDPPDARVTLAAPPGTPGVVIAAYELAYAYTTTYLQREGKPPAVLGPVRVPIAPTLVPAGSATRAGAPVTLDVPVGDRRLKDLFTGPFEGQPLGMVASISFYDDQGVPVADLALNTLQAAVPIRALRGLPPTGSSPPRRPPPPADPTSLVAFAPAAGFTVSVTRTSEPTGDGPPIVASAFDWGADVAPPTVYLRAPANGPGKLVAAYEVLPYAVAAEPGPKPPPSVGAHLVPIPPRWVGTAEPVGIDVPLRSLALDHLLGGPDDPVPARIEAEVTFRDEQGQPLLDAKLEPIKAVIPIVVR